MSVGDVMDRAQALEAPGRARRALDALGWRIEDRGGMRLKVEDNGGVGTATTSEAVMYDALEDIALGRVRGREPETWLWCKDDPESTFPSIDEWIEYTAPFSGGEPWTQEFDRAAAIPSIWALIVPPATDADIWRVREFHTKQEAETARAAATLARSASLDGE